MVLPVHLCDALIPGQTKGKSSNIAGRYFTTVKFVHLHPNIYLFVVSFYSSNQMKVVVIILQVVILQQSSLSISIQYPSSSKHFIYFLFIFYSNNQILPCLFVSPSFILLCARGGSPNIYLFAFVYSSFKYPETYPPRTSLHSY